MLTVAERRPISEQLAAICELWLTQNGLTPTVDESWLELVCEDGETFTREEALLVLAVPPCDVATGDSLDAGRTQTVGQQWPEPGAEEGEVPLQLALATTFERTDDGWVGVTELPPPVRQLFTVDDPGAMLTVLTATRRTLGTGAMSISGDPDGRLSFTVIDDGMVAWGSTEAQVPEPFIYWLDVGPAQALAVPLRGATHVVGSLGVRPDLIIKNDHDVETRVLLDEDRPSPELLGEDHFEHHAEGRVEGLHVDREGGLGRDALAAIAAVRPGDVSLAVADDGSLVIGGTSEQSTTFTLEGPGFTTREDRRGSPIVVPYVVALAIYDGAPGGPVDLTVDAQWGRVRRADLGITVQWTR